MADGTYWNGKRWVSPEEMMLTRRMIRAKPVAPTPKPDDQPKETTDADRK